MAQSEEEIDEEVTFRVRPRMMTHQQSSYPKENYVETDSECFRASKMLIRDKSTDSRKSDQRSRKFPPGKRSGDAETVTEMEICIRVINEANS